jgi:hypothetical protein
MVLWVKLQDGISGICFDDFLVMQSEA